ncbi:MAG: hypothetical protein Ta2F_17380 [Termitinemataceae bacterium]|nr:MAG: hypothetical protein Ta2F_17380 [Termitinemataceae bacterium]
MVLLWQNLGGIGKGCIKIMAHFSNFNTEAHRGTQRENKEEKKGLSNLVFSELDYKKYINQK